MRSKVALAILLVSVCAITAGNLTNRSMIRLEEASGWTDHTFIVLVALGELEAQLNQIESNQRGFLLTGDGRYIEPNDRLEKAIGSNLESLRTLISDNSIQRLNTGRLKEMVPKRIQALNQTLEIYKNQGMSAVIALLRTNEGKILMDNIRGVLDDMAREENRLLVLRRADEELQRQNNNLIIVVSAVATLILVAFIALLIRDDLALRKQLRETIERLALTDSLTGLPNRVAFGERLEAALARARRNNRNLAILVFDLDGFKAINDRFGHLAGDQVLQQVANRVRGTLRASDTLARLGGDEFIVLIDEIAASTDAAVAASKIIDAVSQPYELNGGIGVVSASVGISLFPDDDTRPEKLAHFADTAMYKAKQAGKARFRYFAQQYIATADDQPV